MCFNRVHLEISQDTSDKYSQIYINKSLDLNQRHWAYFFLYFCLLNFFSSVCRNAKVQCTSVTIKMKSKWHTTKYNKKTPYNPTSKPKRTLSIWILHLFGLCGIFFLFMWNVYAFWLCSVFTEPLFFIRIVIPWDFRLSNYHLSHTFLLPFLDSSKPPMYLSDTTECSSNKMYFDCNASPKWTSQTPLQLSCHTPRTDHVCIQFFSMSCFLYSVFFKWHSATQKMRL